VAGENIDPSHRKESGILERSYTEVYMFVQRKIGSPARDPIGTKKASCDSYFSTFPGSFVPAMLPRPEREDEREKAQAPFPLSYSRIKAKEVVALEIPFALDRFSNPVFFDEPEIVFRGRRRYIEMNKEPSFVSRPGAWTRPSEERRSEIPYRTITG
jgi:hypothetical protein